MGVIVVLIAGLAGGYFLRWGTEPTKTATTTVTETVAPPAETPQGPRARGNRLTMPSRVLFVTRLADHPNDDVLAPDATAARVDGFLAAFNGDERPITYWNADSHLWTWNAWMTPGFASSDQNFASREGPVVEWDDLVAFRVTYGADGKGFGATWVQEWSTTKGVVVRMWVMP